MQQSHKSLGKEGHRGTDCWHKEENKDKRPRNFVAGKVSATDASTGADVPVIALMAHEVTVSKNEAVTCVLSAGTMTSVTKVQHKMNVWIADSGAMSHMTFSKEGMKNLKEDTTRVVMGDGQTMSGKYHGDLDLYPVSKQGILLPKITLTNVLYVPELSYNLFSINSALNKNLKLTASGKDGYVIHNDKVKLLFEHKIAMLDSYLFVGFMQRVGAAALPATLTDHAIMVNDAHAKLGHCLKALARKARWTETSLPT